jgi:predicted nucleotidyltransferase
MRHIASRLAEIPGVVAVTLGGSRAQGTHRPDSDWDFGLYYEDTIDPSDVEALDVAPTAVEVQRWPQLIQAAA